MAEVGINIKINTDGTVKVEQLLGDFKALGKGAEKSSKKIDKGFEKANKTLKKTKTPVDSLVKRFSSLGGVITSVAGPLALGALVVGMNSAIKASNEFESALIGLNSVSEAFGVSTDGAKLAAQSLAADGLLSVSDAATSLKNLLARGFGLGEATQLLNAFKDSAAFGRQAALTLGEAIRGATEGLKNENSMLVDNAGITKNVSVIWADYAKIIGVGAKSLTLVQKRQAELTGILKEAKPFLGDAAKLTKTYQGQTSKLTASLKILQKTIGDDIKKELTGFVGGTDSAVTGMTRFIKNSGIVADSLGLLLLPLKFVSNAFSLVGGIAGATLDTVIAGFDKLVGSQTRVSQSATKAASDIAALQDSFTALTQAISGGGLEGESLQIAIDSRKAIVKEILTVTETERMAAKERQSIRLKAVADIAKGEIQEISGAAIVKAEIERQKGQKIVDETFKGFEIIRKEREAEQARIGQNVVDLELFRQKRATERAERELLEFEQHKAFGDTQLADDNARILASAEQEKLGMQIVADARSRFLAQEIADQKARAQAISGALSFISSSALAENKKTFLLSKAANTAMAIMNTHAAATEALKIPPPPLGLALAGIITAAGIANVAKIAGTSFGQSSTSAVNSSASIPTVQSIQPAQQEQQAPGIVANITLQGDRTIEITDPKALQDIGDFIRQAVGSEF